MLLLELLIAIAEPIDAAIASAHVWAPIVITACCAAVLCRLRRSARRRARARTTERNTARPGAYSDPDTVTLRVPTCTDWCPDWCPRTCLDVSTPEQTGES
ncbi:MULTISPECIES: hypothetical protein [Streptomyces]|uniref:MYXO-CTERM domain-containing protein n=1 Tax=Streptomyces lonegramiae TaxID=3075524 RepID=A0ABU2XCE8_9ACTN|nr:hypothetical protein [Streptomyces sp. DSM 41529]MDT0543590.1 hypothetical protein [Streptomyces sp. DSM 41529]